MRNDLYVTLVQGEFKKGGKYSEKNVEVTMCVCNQHGKVLQVSIHYEHFNVLQYTCSVSLCLKVFIVGKM